MANTPVIQYKNVKIQLVDMDPCMAAELLENNFHNRPLMSTTVNTYAEEIIKGNWKFNGDTIRVDKNGMLLDGQHRLVGIIQSGKTVKVILVTELEPDVFDTIDVGVTRTLDQLMAINGYPNPKPASSAVAYIVNYEAGRVPSSSTSLNKNYKSKASRLQYYVKHRKTIDSSTTFYLEHRGLKKVYPPGQGIFLHHLFASKNADMAANFMEAVEGDLSKKIQVATFLRDRLDTDARAYTKMTPAHRLAISIKAWNTYRKGNKGSRFGIKWQQHGPRQEKFPKAI